MAEAGIDVLIKIETGSGTFSTVAGFRASTISFNGTTIDATNGESPNRWRELINNHGTKSLNLSGQGVFKAATTDTTVQSAFFGTGAITAQAIVPGLGTFEGDFMVVSCEYAGNHDGEATYSYSLESAGQITFAAG
ncbi:phage major tail protein, TP901-1 family [Roseovarius sp. SYSU LYC5161]|uniref:phage major tail protein, TP901-1 family n=1 Tax=Roseovarius halophilus (ex Wu et al. 2025) TaxID=3376060 RepID=UPI00399C3167